MRSPGAPRRSRDMPAGPICVYGSLRHRLLRTVLHAVLYLLKLIQIDNSKSLPCRPHWIPGHTS